MSDTPNMIEYALQAAGRGWRIFPIHTTISGHCSCGRDCGDNASKHPRIKRWQDHATSDPAQIRAWWSKWKDANIGLVTGGGLAVLDIDGPDNLAVLGALAGPHGGFPETLMAATGRGWHAYFASMLQGDRMRDKVLVRAGGYVILPPSLHRSGKRYQWVKNVPLAPMPSWFEMWLQDTDKSKLTSNGQTSLVEFGPLPSHLTNRSQATTNKAISALATEWSAHQEARIRGALTAIPASCQRDPWLHIGMALHALGWERPDGTNIGFEIWDVWSATCPEKYSLFDVETRWNSFGARAGVNLGTLFHMAKEHGWKGDVVVPRGVESFEKAIPELRAAIATAVPVTETVAPAANRTIFDDPDVPGQPDAAPHMNGHASTFAPLQRPNSIVFPDVNEDGNPRATCTNARVALEGLGIECSEDVFHGRQYLAGHQIAQWAGELSDAALLMARMLIKQIYDFDPGEKPIRDAALQLCFQNQFNPVTDYLDTIQWDGVSRLRTWLADYLGAERSVLNEAVGGLVLIAAVRRARQPGIKFDQIMVLEGPEGKNKSTAIEVLAGNENFSDQSILTLDDRAQQEAMQGIWLYEIADLAGMHRADVEKVKAFASRRVDRARPAYGRARVDRPRQCIFFATTNDATYLKSTTGNRRFWPVTVGHINVTKLVADRDQLWAEAVVYERRGAVLMLPEKLWGAAGALQDERMDVHPWESIIAKIEGTLIQGQRRVTTEEILDRYLFVPRERWNQTQFKTVVWLMRKHGWIGPTKLRDGEKTHRGYWRAE